MRKDTPSSRALGIGKKPEERIPAKNWEDLKKLLDQEKVAGLLTPPNSLRVELTVHSVGQGLFYSGRLNNFTFVYDCGAADLSPRSFLQDQVSRFRSELDGHVLDLMIISHFHADHISGLKQLIEGTHVKYFVLPYLTPVERAYVAATEDNEDDWFYEFLSDPGGYLGGEGRESRIVFVGGGENGQSGSDPGAEGPGNDEEGRDVPESLSIDDSSFEMRDNESSRNLILRLDPDLSSLGSRLIVKDHRGILNISRLWAFRFFNYRVDQNKLERFEASLRANLHVPDSTPLTKAAVEQAIRSGSGRKSLKKAYAAMGGDFNNTSLLAFHGPRGNPIVHFHFLKWSKLQVGLGGVPIPDGPNEPFDSDGVSRLGVLLTGDANLNYNWEDFESHFRNYFVRIRRAFIPHHGSKLSWNPSLRDKVDPVAWWLVSAGLKNSYGHPEFSVLEDLVNRNRTVVWANELSPVNEGFRLGWNRKP